MQSIVYTKAPVCPKRLFQMRELLENTGWIHPRQSLKHGGVGQLVLQYWKIWKTTGDNKQQYPVCFAN